MNVQSSLFVVAKSGQHREVLQWVSGWTNCTSTPTMEIYSAMSRREWLITATAWMGREGWVEKKPTSKVQITCDSIHRAFSKGQHYKDREHGSVTARVKGSRGVSMTVSGHRGGLCLHGRGLYLEYSRAYASTHTLKWLGAIHTLYQSHCPGSMWCPGLSVWHRPRHGVPYWEKLGQGSTTHNLSSLFFAISFDSLMLSEWKIFFKVSNRIKMIITANI